MRGVSNDWPNLLFSSIPLNRKQQRSGKIRVLKFEKIGRGEKIDSGPPVLRPAGQPLADQNRSRRFFELLVSSTLLAWKHQCTGDYLDTVIVENWSGRED